MSEEEHQWVWIDKRFKQFFQLIRSEQIKMFLSYVLLLIITGINSISCNHRTKRIVGGIPAAVAPADEPIVYVRFTGKAARVEGVRTPYYYSFTGLRYAHPPTGKDRFLVRLLIEPPDDNLKNLLY